MIRIEVHCAVADRIKDMSFPCLAPTGLRCINSASLFSAAVSDEQVKEWVEAWYKTHRLNKPSDQERQTATNNFRSSTQLSTRLAGNAYPSSVA